MWAHSKQRTSVSIVWMVLSLSIMAGNLILQLLQQCWDESITVEKPNVQVKDHVSFFVVISHSSGAQRTRVRSDANDSGGNFAASETSQEKPPAVNSLTLQAAKTLNLTQLTAALLIAVDPTEYKSAIWWSHSLNFTVLREEIVDLQIKAWQNRETHNDLEATVTHLISACCSIMREKPTKRLDFKDVVWIAIVILFSIVALYIVAKILYIRVHRTDPDEDDDTPETIEEMIEMDDRSAGGIYTNIISDDDIAVVTPTSYPSTVYT
ncbi:uncharacterized protein LOC143036983 isoform X2 [Oratosquilla oratoria]|uniref:uncharacterized protein LOC143036983 isoform X2 n=1 Tax=Oratosquilla oratoria TaxID=337810 RepID=UPI003F758DF8